MNILVTGAGGQVGWELLRTAPENVEAIGFLSNELNITDKKQVIDTIGRLKPDCIINAAAYTAVDKAEQEPQKAYAVNGDGVANLAVAAEKTNSRIIHISTDFVFDGEKSSPYLPDDLPNPTGVYGKSKLAGERKLFELTRNENALIIRTAWVYSSHGNNFVKTMLRLMHEREQLGVVADQVGTPTWANGLARSIWHILPQKLAGILHWTDAGVASWYDFAVAIHEEALRLGILETCSEIRPIRTEDYPTPAKRPAYSVLDKTAFWEKLAQPVDHWRESLRKMLEEIAE